MQFNWQYSASCIAGLVSIVVVDLWAWANCSFCVFPFSLHIDTITNPRSDTRWTIHKTAIYGHDWCLHSNQSTGRRKSFIFRVCKYLFWFYTWKSTSLWILFLILAEFGQRFYGKRHTEQSNLVLIIRWKNLQSNVAYWLTNMVTNVFGVMFSVPSRVI